MMGVEKALLIDYEYCLGCSECETACLAAHGSGPEALGIKVTKLGPWKTRDGSWQYDFVPIPTDWCDLCEERTDRGSRPACARRCRYGAITYGTVDELAEKAKEMPRTWIYVPEQ